MSGNSKDLVLSYFEKELDRVNYWLAFAEAKNAALAALDIAVVVAYLRLYGLNSTNGCLKTVIAGVMILMLMSLGLVLLSFWPKLTKKQGKLLVNGKTVIKKSRVTQIPRSQIKNLIYYEEIAAFENTEMYLHAAFARYGFASQYYSLCFDYGEEIWINSKITLRKYKLFRGALFFDFMAIIVVAILIIMA